MINDLKKKDNYVVIPSNGSFILGTHPPIIKEDEYLNEKFENNIRVFGPYKVFSPNFNSNPEPVPLVVPVKKIEDEDDQPKGDTFLDSMSGTLGAAILGPIIGSALAQSAGLSGLQSNMVTNIAKEAIHAGHIAMEIADTSDKEDISKNPIAQKINAKTNAVRVFGVDGAIPDAEEMSKIVAEKTTRTKFSNLSAQEQFESRHGGKIVYGKNGKK